MFLPKQMIEKHGFTVGRVLDLPSLFQYPRADFLEELLYDFPPEVYKKSYCTDKTAKFGKILDSLYQEFDGFDLEQLNIELQNAGIGNGAVFELFQRIQNNLIHTIYVYCESIQELRDFVESRFITKRIVLKGSVYTGRQKALEVSNIIPNNSKEVTLVCPDQNTVVTSSFLLHLQKLCDAEIHVTGGSDVNTSEHNRFLRRLARTK